MRYLILTLMLFASSANAGGILILGDSISNGYSRYVEAALPCAKRIPHNVRDSVYFWQHMNGWMEGEDTDTIYFNVGMWDLAHRDKSSDHPYVLVDASKYPVANIPAVYEAFLTLIVEDFQKTYPRAKLIFALTTDVPEGSFGRNPEDVAVYNSIARKVMARHMVQVDDLNAWMDGYDFLHVNNHGNLVHYNAQGYQLLAEEVTRTLIESGGCH